MGKSGRQRMTSDSDHSRSVIPDTSSSCHTGSIGRMNDSISGGLVNDSVSSLTPVQSSGACASPHNS